LTILPITPSEAKSYDRISRALHWLIAALAVFVISLGWAIGEAPRNTPRATCSWCCTVRSG